MSTRVLKEAAPDSVVDRRYVLRREIARGGMGSVFEAEHLVTRAKLALKTLTRPALDHEPTHARMLREARVLGALRHPNIVAIYDAGMCDEHGPFLALEMIDGRPLDGLLLARHALPVGQAVALLVQLCAALDEVHLRGIVHRDLKPSNVLVGRTPIGDQVELIDFGVARIGEEEDPPEGKLTKAGELLGTVEYMAPEQITGRGTIDARCDVYAAGVLLYECLTGEVPFSGHAMAVISSLIAGTRPAPIRGRRADVPLELEAAVRTALEIDPNKRFASARDFATACLNALAGSVPQLALLDVRDDRAIVPEPKPTLPGVTAVPMPVPEAPPAADVQRRRQFVRAPYVTPVRILLDQGTCDGRTEDISEGGALIVTDTECARDQKVKVRLPLPASGRVVSLEGLTKWIKTRRNQRAIGVEFQNTPEDIKAEIRAYVALMSGQPTKPSVET